MNQESEPLMTEKDRANFGRTLQRNHFAQRQTHIRGVNEESGTKFVKKLIVMETKRLYQSEFTMRDIKDTN